VPSWSPDPVAFPRLSLFETPSPFARLERLETALGGRAEIWIKREDLLPLAFGGNKLRNLEFLVGAAVAAGADTLITAGRRWSNHARLTAAAGAVAGLDVHLVLSGPIVEPANPGSVLDELLGARIHRCVTDKRAEREDTVARVEEALRAVGRHPYVIGVGGSGVTGAIGHVLAGLEVLDQARGRGFVPDDLVVPSATGGTQAGILVGLRTGGAPTAVHGIAVTPPDELGPKLSALVAGLAEVPGLAAVPEDAIHLDGAQLGAGYGRATAAGDDATRLLARTEGILVDPIYTAKGLAGLIERVRSGVLDGHRVVFWHAGGTPGLFEPLDA